MVMAILAQRLPVAPFPEQNGIASVRNDMVNNGGRRQLADFSALCTERILFEEQRPGRTPPAVVTALSGITTHAICAVFDMILAVNAAVAEVRTAGISAWASWLSGHSLLNTLRNLLYLFKKVCYTQIMGITSFRP